MGNILLLPQNFEFVHKSANFPRLSFRACSTNPNNKIMHSSRLWLSCFKPKQKENPFLCKCHHSRLILAKTGIWVTFILCRWLKGISHSHTCHGCWLPRVFWPIITLTTIKMGKQTTNGVGSKRQTKLYSQHSNVFSKCALSQLLVVDVSNSRSSRITVDFRHHCHFGKRQQFHLCRHRAMEMMSQVVCPSRSRRTMTSANIWMIFRWYVVYRHTINNEQTPSS